ncbi:unnamed protein product [Schistocephalus solidus]|uniref:UBC core domain-containing protein n=1 Tax=Schistocephalus solidus TaxID=70667 RepID=A0A183TD47_SCHSO|nr:unnamed protein product [Schistocephalus solidus]
MEREFACSEVAMLFVHLSLVADTFRVRMRKKSKKPKVNVSVAIDEVIRPYDYSVPPCHVPTTPNRHVPNGILKCEWLEAETQPSRVASWACEPGIYIEGAFLNFAMDASTRQPFAPLIPSIVRRREHRLIGTDYTDEMDPQAVM